MEKSIDQLFNEGIELRDSGQLDKARNLFLEVIKLFPTDSKIGLTYTVLGGVYFNLNEFQSSKEYFEKASGLKPQSELASLGLYLSYIELENFEKAIEELKRFLDKYPAELYKTTLGELLEDMENGYALTFKETILPLAKRNGLI